MKSHLLAKYQDSAAKLRIRLRQPPNTPANRVVLRPGMKSFTYAPTIRKLERIEATIKTLLVKGLT